MRQIEYWIESSETDYKAMNNSYASRDYVWSLFTGHLVIEKLLKAIYSKEVKKIAPRINNLLKLAFDSKMILTEEIEDVLDEITTFNINARYPDYKKKSQKV